jgi:hypothetical protein
VPPSGHILKHFLLLARREKGVSLEKVKISLEIDKKIADIFHSDTNYL